MFLQPIFLGVDPFLEEADADANANFWEVLSSSVQGFFDLEEQDLTIFFFKEDNYRGSYKYWWIYI